MANLVPTGAGSAPGVANTFQGSGSFYAIPAGSGNISIVNGVQFANTPGSFYLGSSASQIEATLQGKGATDLPARFISLSEANLSQLIGDLPEAGHYTTIHAGSGGIIPTEDIVNALLIGTGVAGEGGIFDTIPGLIGGGIDDTEGVIGDLPDNPGGGDTTDPTDPGGGKSSDTTKDGGSDGTGEDTPGKSTGTAAGEVAAAGLAGALGLSGLQALAIRILEGLVGAALLFLGLSALTGTGPSGNPITLAKSTGRAAGLAAAA